MNVLVCGATGFLGGALSEMLKNAGHRVIRGVRKPSEPDDILIDFSISSNLWAPFPDSIDVVINAIGIIIEKDNKQFERLHHTGAIALFNQAIKHNVKRIIHISALGAETQITPYFLSKYQADQYLEQQNTDYYILRPALIYGNNGASAGLFRQLAYLPIIPIPEIENTLFQPVKMDDVIEIIMRAVVGEIPPRQTINIVGADHVSYREMLQSYRTGMGLGTAKFITIPKKLLSISSCLIKKLKVPLLFTPDNWLMLQTSFTSSSDPMEKALGRSATPLQLFIKPSEKEFIRLKTEAVWRDYLLRYSLAFIWLSSGLISSFLYPREDALLLLKPFGLSGILAVITLYGASLFDAILGVLTIIRPRRYLWYAQIILISIYSILIAIGLPELLLHPFEPVIKNIIIVVILILLIMESKK